MPGTSHSTPAVAWKRGTPMTRLPSVVARGGGLAFFSTDKPRSLIDGNLFTSAGKDRHQGVEFNVFGEPMRGLRLLGGATWLDARR